MNRRYFGTDGVRGKVGSSAITPDFVLKLGQAAGRVLRRHSPTGRATVLIGKDTRVSGYMLEAALQAGFSSAGADVVLCGPIPTPAVAYLTRMEIAPALPPQPERLPLYRNGCFYPPHRDRSHVPGPREAALLELWQDWSRREAGLRQEFMAMLRELDARRGDLFSYAVSDLGRNADTTFSTQCLLDSLFQSRTEAEQRFRQALDDASLHLRLSLNMAVALGR